MMKLAFITILANVFLVKSADRCDDELVHEILVTVCGLQKRSFSYNSDWLKFRPFFKLINSDGVERQYKELIGDVDEVFKIFSKKLDKKKTKEVTITPQRPTHLSVYKEMQNRKTPSKFRLSDDFSKLMTKRDFNSNPYTHDVDQDIVDKIIECCSNPKCFSSDFKGICDK